MSRANISGRNHMTVASISQNSILPSEDPCSVYTYTKDGEGMQPTKVDENSYTLLDVKLEHISNDSYISITIEERISEEREKNLLSNNETNMDDKEEQIDDRKVMEANRLRVSQGFFSSKILPTSPDKDTLSSGDGLIISCSTIVRSLINWVKKRKKNTYVWTFLLVLGTMGGILSFVQDFLILHIFNGRFAFSSLSSHAITQIIFWTLYNLLFVSISVLITNVIEPSAEGSGIPAVKAILSGVQLEGPLSLRTLFVKLFCIPCVIGAGMTVGKVGPSIHIGAALSNQLLRIPLFRNIKENKFLMSQMIACGCALGVGANFGTPAGGVFFAMEVIGTYYSLRTYLKSFFVAMVAALTSKLLHSLHKGSMVILAVWYVDIPYPGYKTPELLIFILMGFIFGILGAFFVILNKMMMILLGSIGKRKLLFFNFSKWKYQRVTFVLENRFLWTLLVTIITSLLTNPLLGQNLSLMPSRMLEDLFLDKPMSISNGANSNWSLNGSIFLGLGIFCAVRILLALINVSLPIPGGTYVPLLVIGASIGRLFGETVSWLFPNVGIIPGGYSVVGAVGLTAATTHAYSTALILLEICGPSFHLPSLLCVTISIRISCWLAPSVYDSIIELRGWSVLREMKTDRDAIKVGRVMTNSDFSYLTHVESSNTIKQILRKEELVDTFPVVDTSENQHFIGIVSRGKLKETLNKLQTSNYLNCNGEPTPLVSQNEDEKNVKLDIESFPFLLSEDTSVLNAHIIFAMLKIERTFVIRTGKLVGIVTKRDLNNSQRIKTTISENLCSFDFLSCYQKRNT